MDNQNNPHVCCNSENYCITATIGKQAPDFHVEGFYKGEKKHYSLEDYKGKWKIFSQGHG